MHTKHPGKHTVYLREDQGRVRVVEVMFTNLED